MTQPCRTDPALEVVEAAMTALADWFKPDSACPAKVGTTTNVRFFAGDGAPLAAWDSHASQGCDEPFVWVRAMRRFRSQSFPTPTVGTMPCDLPRVIAVELGVGWCAVVDQEPRWDDYQREAEISTDVAWRLEEAVCMTSKLLRNDDRRVGTDTIVPYGPEGGVIAWTAVIYATY
ncbi:hypothetical protein I5G60_gp24 [Mycobacterium phage Saguaro]|uniref:Uncharacterized protein n=1 Tax=Mycobacterium phage Saguaro TaxID=2315616 RepID=A0A386KA04_9CAUD|nr:hypothetical protein I5G60_gp24 [Mycobacterium phage Saguaro]AYD82019.1 hypothetical protein SEA_SAGUARO_24 [Mycobacterium phage Saguaro]